MSACKSHKIETITRLLELEVIKNDIKIVISIVYVERVWNRGAASLSNMAKVYKRKVEAGT